MKLEGTTQVVQSLEYKINHEEKSQWFKTTNWHVQVVVMEAKCRKATYSCISRLELVKKSMNDQTKRHMKHERQETRDNKTQNTHLKKFSHSYDALAIFK